MMSRFKFYPSKRKKHISNWIQQFESTTQPDLASSSSSSSTLSVVRSREEKSGSVRVIKGVRPVKPSRPEWNTAAHSLTAISP